MDKFKIYRKDNYIVITNNLTQETFYGFVKESMVDKSNANKAAYRIFNVKDFNDKTGLVVDQILKEDGSPYTQDEFETFYTQNTGNFNGGGTAPGIPEAPIDGIQYGRQDGTWTEITGGGGSQDLQSVLDIGNIATSDDGIVLNDLSLENSVNLAPAQISIGNLTSGSRIDLFNDDNIPQIKIVNGVTLTTNFLVSNTDSEATGNFSIMLPKFTMANPSTVTLATTDDITMQKVLEAGNYGSVISPNGFNNATLQATASDVGLRAGFSTTKQNPSDANEFTANAVYSENGQLLISQNHTLDGGVTTKLTTVSIETPASNSSLKFPAPADDGTYTLALKEEITLQSAIDNGSEYSSEDGDIFFGIIPLDDTGNKGIYINVHDGEFQNNISATKTASQINSSHQSSGTGWSIETNANILNSAEFRLIQNKNSNTTNIMFEEPVAEDVNLKFPAKSTGDYVLATTVDVVKGSLIASLTSSGNVDQLLTTTDATLNFDTDDSAAYGAISRTSNTFTISSGGDGIYTFNVQPQVTENAVMNVTTIWCRKNGVNVTNSGIVNSSTGIGDTRVIPLIITLDLVAGDQITFRGMTSIVNGATLDFTTASSPKPSVPSIIVDIKGWKK